MRSSIQSPNYISMPVFPKFHTPYYIYVHTKKEKQLFKNFFKNLLMF